MLFQNYFQPQSLLNKFKITQMYRLYSTNTYVKKHNLKFFSSPCILNILKVLWYKKLN